MGFMFGGGKDKFDFFCLVQRCYVRWVLAALGYLRQDMTG